MMEYIIKIILCSALFLLVYFLFLEKEKMYRFNRFYLLFSIAISLVAPFITIHIEKDMPLQTVNNFVLLPGETIQENISTQKISKIETLQKHLNTQEILLLVYWSITAFLLILFATNLLKIYLKTRNKKYIPYKCSRLILIEENLTPHSFLNCMFLNKVAFEKGEIEEEILYHELTHIKQHHSLDVLLIELVSVFFWFNPFIHLYKRAIKLNHEFLADEEVINKFQNIHSYQYLLIDKTSQQKAIAVTSQFNFLITKKRLIMITKHKSPKMAFIKQSLAIVVLITAVFAFSAKSIVAQKIKDTVKPITKTTPKSTPKSKDSVMAFWAGIYAGGTKEGVSEELLTEYQNVINRTKTPQMSWYKFRDEIPSSDGKRLETIFMQMNLSQQQQQTVIFMRPSRPLPQVVPTQTQFDNFKNEKIYGVWVNNKKVVNSVLNNYTSKDFTQFDVSKLYGAAKKNQSYSYQVNMMTKEYYQAYYDRTIADKSNQMVFQSTRVVKK
ncbi:MAG: M56 family metallopeptidase [Ginsengibacter sp.]